MGRITVILLLPLVVPTNSNNVAFYKIIVHNLRGFPPIPLEHQDAFLLALEGRPELGCLVRAYLVWTCGEDHKSQHDQRESEAEITQAEGQLDYLWRLHLYPHNSDLHLGHGMAELEGAGIHHRSRRSCGVSFNHLQTLTSANELQIMGSS